jgi:hypothetical protein
VLAYTIRSCRPSVRAAACSSVVNAGSARTPNTAALGSNSRSNCNRFGASSPDKRAVPVRFPPGRLRLATRPNATGSAPVPKTMGMVVVAAFAASAASLPTAAITATRRRELFGAPGVEAAEADQDRTNMLLRKVVKAGSRSLSVRAGLTTGFAQGPASRRQTHRAACGCTDWLDPAD